MSKALLLNCNGLPQADLITLLPLIAGASPPYDLLLLVETWFASHSFALSLPFFLASSPLPLAPPTGHRPGGLLVLGSLNAKAALSSSSSTSHSITLSFPSL